MVKPEAPMLGDVTTTAAADLKPEEVDSFLDQVVDAERRTWPPELQASRQKFESRIKTFPQGFVAIRVNDRLEGVTTSQILDYDPADTSHKTWDEITDNGMIANTHTPDGNALYVSSVGVTADAQGKGLGGKLVDAQKALAQRLGLKYLYLGARIPGYAAYIKAHGDIPVDDYLRLRNDEGEPIDPEIRFYERQGLRPARVIPEFEPDDASRNYGVVMLWNVS